MASVNESKGVDQIQAIAILGATVSLLDSWFESERSFTEPSGQCFRERNATPPPCSSPNGSTAPFRCSQRPNALNATLSRQIFRQRLLLRFAGSRNSWLVVYPLSFGNVFFRL
jgi:hypothetical protein